MIDYSLLLGINVDNFDCYRLISNMGKNALTSKVLRVYKVDLVFISHLSVRATSLKLFINIDFVILITVEE